MLWARLARLRLAVPAVCGIVATSGAYRQKVECMPLTGGTPHEYKHGTTERVYLQPRPGDADGEDAIGPSSPAVAAADKSLRKLMHTELTRVRLGHWGVFLREIDQDHPYGFMSANNMPREKPNDTRDLERLCDSRIGQLMGNYDRRTANKAKPDGFPMTIPETEDQFVEVVREVFDLLPEAKRVYRRTLDAEERKVDGRQPGEESEDEELGRGRVRERQTKAVERQRVIFERNLKSLRIIQQAVLVPLWMQPAMANVYAIFQASVADEPGLVALRDVDWAFQGSSAFRSGAPSSVMEAVRAKRAAKGRDTRSCAPPPHARARFGQAQKIRCAITAHQIGWCSKMNSGTFLKPTFKAIKIYQAYAQCEGDEKKGHVTYFGCRPIQWDHFYQHLLHTGLTNQLSGADLWALYESRHEDLNRQTRAGKHPPDEYIELGLSGVSEADARTRDAEKGASPAPRVLSRSARADCHAGRVGGAPAHAPVFDRCRIDGAQPAHRGGPRPPPRSARRVGRRGSRQK